jgi:hypothetical protein
VSNFISNLILYHIKTMTQPNSKKNYKNYVANINYLMDLKKKLVDERIKFGYLFSQNYLIVILTFLVDFLYFLFPL